MDESPANSEDLLQRAAEGTPSAQAELLERYREKLRQMVALRLDRRLASRIDPSDIVQETLHNAHQRLPEYFADRPTSFYPWLRGIAWDRLIDLYRVHVAAAKRSVLREQPWVGPNEEAVAELAQSIAVSSAANPRRQAMLAEMQQRIRAALLELSRLDQEVLTLRYLEHLSVQEIAEVLCVDPSVVTTRHVRALKRLRAKLGPSFDT
jgi:RNA polymerase sigma-70 factor (ECF subfamily)